MTISARSFGLHINKATSFSSPQTPWHDVGQRSVRLWDTSTRWRNLEPTKGAFEFGLLDEYVSSAVANNCHILLTLGQPPAWATGGEATDETYNANPPDSDTDWTDYIEAVVARMPAGTAYEIWNEPDLTAFYVGTKARLAELHILAHDAIKAIDPTATIVSASVSRDVGYLHGYLSLVSDHTDVVGVHGYVYPVSPSATVQRIKWARAVARRHGLAAAPVWDTEAAWHSFYDEGVLNNGPASSSITAYDDASCMPQALAAAYVARWLVANEVGGADRSYWYGLDYWWNAVRMVTDLSSPSTLTDAALAHRYWAGFLAGSTISRFRQVPPLYSVDWSKNGASGRIYWCRDDATQNVDLSGFSSGVDVLGAAITLTASYSVTHSPVIVTR